jgi:RNA polymerase sigma-54 factor
MVQFNIRKMIEYESLEKPLSDQAISQSLHLKGIRIARRTVTKYRKKNAYTAFR